MRIIFAGTPEISSIVLQDLIDNKLNIIASLTQPDRPKGRGKKITCSEVKILSQKNNIPVYQPIKLNDPDIIDILTNLKPDLIIVIAYGLILPKNILTLPKYGCWNIHVSLLPKWRGAAPIQRAIESGDTKTGVTIMQMDEGLDTGDILLQESCEINNTDNSKILHDKLAKLSAPALLKTLDKLKNNTLAPEPQDHSQKTIAPKLSKPEAMINWSEPANIINQKIRAFNPWPVAQTQIKDDKDKLEILRIYETEIISNPINLKNANNKPGENKPGEIINSDKKNGLIIKCGNINKDDINNSQSFLKINTIQFPGKNISSINELLNSDKYKNLLKTGSLFI